MYIEHNSNMYVAQLYIDNGFTNVKYWTHQQLVGTPTHITTCDRLQLQPHTTVCQHGIHRIGTR